MNYFILVSVSIRSYSSFTGHLILPFSSKFPTIQQCITQSSNIMDQWTRRYLQICPHVFILYFFLHCDKWKIYFTIFQHWLHSKGWSGESYSSMNSVYKKCMFHGPKVSWTIGEISCLSCHGLDRATQQVKPQPQGCLVRLPIMNKETCGVRLNFSLLS